MYPTIYIFLRAGLNEERDAVREGTLYRSGEPRRSKLHLFQFFPGQKCLRLQYWGSSPYTTKERATNIWCKCGEAERKSQSKEMPHSIFEFYLPAWFWYWSDKQANWIFFWVKAALHNNGIQAKHFKCYLKIEES